MQLQHNSISGKIKSKRIEKKLIWVDPLLCFHIVLQNVREMVATFQCATTTLLICKKWTNQTAFGRKLHTIMKCSLIFSKFASQKCFNLINACNYVRMPWAHQMGTCVCRVMCVWRWWRRWWRHQQEQQLRWQAMQVKERQKEKSNQ